MGDHLLELAAKLVYNLSRVGRHQLPPLRESWLGYLDYPPKSDVFQLTVSHNVVQLVPTDFSQTLFILWDLREAYIREVDQTLFGDEAELVV